MRYALCAAIAAIVVGGCSSDPEPVQGAAGSTAEAGADVAPDQGTADQATPDVKTDTGPTCTPQSVAGWTPAWKAPTGAHQGACGAGEASALIDACFGDDATEESCSEAETTYAACDTCLFTDDTASQWGPIVYFSEVDYYDTNEGGCVALVTGETAATGCGAKLNAAYDCGLAACGAVCPVNTDADFVALDKCLAAAEADPAMCKTYVDEANTCYEAALTAHPEVSMCAWDGTEDYLEVFKRVGELFCGEEAADGGTDAGEDAAGEDAAGEDALVEAEAQDAAEE
jgi:hypothetical protein